MSAEFDQARREGDLFLELRERYYAESRPWWRPARFDSYERAWARWSRRFARAGRRAHADMAAGYGKPWSEIDPPP